MLSQDRQMVYFLKKVIFNSGFELKQTANINFLLTKEANEN